MINGWIVYYIAHFSVESQPKIHTLFFFFAHGDLGATMPAEFRSLFKLSATLYAKHL